IATQHGIGPCGAVVTRPAIKQEGGRFFDSRDDNEPRLVVGVDHDGYAEPFCVHQARYASFEAIARARIKGSRGAPRMRHLARRADRRHALEKTAIGPGEGAGAGRREAGDISPAKYEVACSVNNPRRQSLDAMPRQIVYS